MQEVADAVLAFVRCQPVVIVHLVDHGTIITTAVVEPGITITAVNVGPGTTIIVVTDVVGIRSIDVLDKHYTT